MPAGYVAQTYRVFDYTLGIRITERATGKEVYNVSARTTGDNGTLLYAMPFLARSALADFPLSNGAVRSVRLPVDKRGGPAAPAANERVVPAAPASVPPSRNNAGFSRRGRPAAPALPSDPDTQQRQRAEHDEQHGRDRVHELRRQAVREAVAEQDRGHVREHHPERRAGTTPM